MLPFDESISSSVAGKEARGEVTACRYVVSHLDINGCTVRVDEGQFLRGSNWFTCAAFTIGTFSYTA